MKTEIEYEMLADFIGKRKWSKKELSDGREQQWDLPMCDGYYPTVKTMKFNSSYDYLMPIVRKIKKLDSTPNSVPFYNIEAKIEFTKILEMPLCAEFGLIYQRTVNFVKWFNSLKP